MNWTRRHTLIAGLALIALTNAIALGGAAYNRAGEPDSSLSLSERELRPPYVWRSQKENSGLALRLQWRVMPEATQDLGTYYYSINGGMPAWLDAQKMASLGFDMERPAARSDVDRNTRYRNQLPREVLIVLEFDGPAYRNMLERAAKAAIDIETKNVGGNGKKNAVELMDRETRRSSRLFAVDAGLDRSALRERYPDRTKYAIVYGMVHPVWDFETQGAAGSIGDLSTPEVNVPLEMRSLFEGVRPDDYAVPDATEKGFEARLAFGRRLEPWLVSATKK